MWQFITLEAGKSKPTAKSLAGKLPLAVSEPQALGVIAHALTHRRYEFITFRCEAASSGPILSDRPRRWVTAEQLANYPLPRPHVKLAEMLAII